MAGVLPSDELTDEPSDFGSLRPGTRLGRYELLLPIARGGMARVWAARQHGQRGFQKLVAIKTILPHLAEEGEFERMFLDEARIASGVHHPNVCEIYELGEERQTLYLAMEWVSGDSLARVLRASGKTEALDPRIVCRILADACAGVHAAHELVDEDGRQLGVVHRDMSPHNILLTMDGVAKVCDFGVAKALGQLHEQTSAGQLKGKINYMSPEQVTGQPVDRRSDVFSIGCVLYEATTGERPFRGDNDFLVMQAILKNEIVLPTSILRSYPPELERIVMRALSAQPILRYPSAERMRFALEELLTKGQLVTQSNVAQVVRARIGSLLERRRERIREVSSREPGADAGAWDASGAPRSDPRDPRSGVKAASAAPASGPPSGGRPPGPFVPKTLQMSAVTPRMGTPALAGPSPVAVPPTVDDLGPRSTSSSTLPNAPPTSFEGEGLAHLLEPEPPTIAREPQERQPPSVSLLQTMPLGMAYPDAVAPTARAQPVPYSQKVHIPIPIVHHSAPPSRPEPLPLPYPHSEEPQATRTGYFVAAFVGLVLAVVIGGGGFWLVNGRRHPRPPAPPPAVTAQALPSAAAMPTVSAPVTAATALASAVTTEPAPDVDAAVATVRPHRSKPKETREPKEPAPSKEPALKEPAPKESGNLPDNPY